MTEGPVSGWTTSAAAFVIEVETNMHTVASSVGIPSAIVWRQCGVLKVDMDMRMHAVLASAGI